VSSITTPGDGFSLVRPGSHLCGQPVWRRADLLAAKPAKTGPLVVHTLDPQADVESRERHGIR
jgi:hypothetical protein